MSRRLIFIWLLIANLLCGQQAALAHMVEHLGDHHAMAAAMVADHEDSGHGSFETLSHACTTCAALAGIELPVAAGRGLLGAVSATLPGADGGETAWSAFPGFPPFLSRGPPVFRN